MDEPRFLCSSGHGLELDRKWRHEDRPNFTGSVCGCDHFSCKRVRGVCRDKVGSIKKIRDKMSVKDGSYAGGTGEGRWS